MTVDGETPRETQSPPLKSTQGQVTVAPATDEIVADSLLSELSILDPQIGTILERHPRQQIQAVLKASISKVSRHQSFLPPAEEAQAWAVIYPKAPERMFDLAERQVSLRERQLEASIDASADTRIKNQSYRLWGLGAGLLVAGGFLVAGTVMTVVGGSVVGGVIVDVFGVGAGMVTAFIHGRPLLDQNTKFRPQQLLKKRSEPDTKAIEATQGNSEDADLQHSNQDNEEGINRPDRVSV